MRNIKRIITTLCCIALLFIVSSLAAAQSDTDRLPSTWDLVRQEMTKKSEPNKPVQSQESVQPTKPAEPSESVESAKTKVASETVQSLLDKYIQTQAKLKTSYISKGLDTTIAETSMKNFPQFKKGVKYKSFDKVELRSDSKNYYASYKHWGDNPLLPGGVERETDVTTTQMLWNGESLFQYFDNPDPSKAALNLTCKEHIKDMKEIHTLCDGQAGGPIRGLFYGSGVTIDKELSHADEISVRPEKEKINGSDCYVINAKTKRSEYVIWIDPNHDYNISQAAIKRNSTTANDPNIYKNPESGTSKLDLKNVVFKNLDGFCVPFECDFSLNVKFDNGDHLTDTHHYKTTEYLINPDHKVLRSFDPNSFIKNGAQVRIIGNSDISYTWKDGKVVDSYGYEVNLSTLKPPSLVDKTLPSLAEFRVDLEPSVFKNNKLLLCFFDYSQRPSRNCVLTLNEKTESLLDKNIFLIFIQTESVTEQTLAAWLTKNEIVPPVGTSKIDLPALGQRWGVQSLPWLILTDKQHKVTAEGFNIADLDEKLGNN